MEIKNRFHCCGYVQRRHAMSKKVHISISETCEKEKTCAWQQHTSYCF